jgi:chromosome segregation ATPase
VIYPTDPGGSPVKTALVAGALVALIASNVYLYVQVDRARSDVAKVRESLLTEFTNLRETSSVTSASHRRNIESLKNQLDEARQAEAQANTQLKAEAKANADAIAKRLAAAQEAERQRVASELSEVKQAASNTSAKLESVTGEVGSVKTEVASTKTELEKTIADLKTVRGDLGVQSGLIATNGKELDALKRLGQRNYFEFKLGKTKQPQRVGDVSITLKKADTKRNRYTIDLLADDKKTEKKDRTINEPVQFYTARARQPYELVVNQVNKDEIVGYLSTPREQIPR